MIRIHAGSLPMQISRLPMPMPPPPCDASRRSSPPGPLDGGTCPRWHVKLTSVSLYASTVKPRPYHLRPRTNAGVTTSQEARARPLPGSLLPRPTSREKETVARCNPSSPTCIRYADTHTHLLPLQPLEGRMTPKLRQYAQKDRVAWAREREGYYQHESHAPNGRERGVEVACLVYRCHRRRSDPSRSNDSDRTSDMGLFDVASRACEGIFRIWWWLLLFLLLLLSPAA